MYQGLHATPWVDTLSFQTAQSLMFCSIQKGCFSWKTWDYNDDFLVTFHPPFSNPNCRRSWGADSCQATCRTQDDTTAPGHQSHVTEWDQMSTSVSMDCSGVWYGNVGYFLCCFCLCFLRVPIFIYLCHSLGGGLRSHCYYRTCWSGPSFPSLWVDREHSKQGGSTLKAVLVSVV